MGGSPFLPVSAAWPGAYEPVLESAPKIRLEPMRSRSGFIPVLFRFRSGSVLAPSWCCSIEQMSERVRFGDCVLDTATRELTRGGRPVSLSPKAFALLALLAERRPAAVSHDDLRDALWPDVEVGGTTLARLVNEVRAAVGDHADHPHVIRTVPRFGYAFCCETEPDAKEPEGRAICAVQWGNRHVPLPPGTYVIGRSPDVPISVPASNVSRRHAQIVVTNAGATIEDLGSRNGTCVGDDRISGRVDLKNGDRIVIGPATLVFHQSDEAETTTGD